jgi:RimJ/RimL family protein N-acetyltransferase
VVATWAGSGAEFAINLGNGVAVGSIAIHRHDRDDRTYGTVGYWVAPHARWSDLASRALRVLAPWAAADLHLRHQEFVHDPANIPSCRAAIAGGFRVDSMTTVDAYLRPRR